MKIQFSIIAVITFFLCVIAFFYLTSKMTKIFIHTKKYKVTIFVLLFEIILLTGFLGSRFLRIRSYLPQFIPILEWCGFISLSIFSFSICCFFVADIFLILINLFNKIFSNKLNYLSTNEINNGRRRFLFSGVFIFSLLLTGKAFYNARCIPKVKKISIPIQNLHNDLINFTIVQLSDFHIGQTIGREYVEKVIEEVNQINADIVVITGDLIDGFVEQIKTETQPLANIKSKHGFYYTTGNHEYYWGAQEWIDYVKSIGGIYLENEHKIVKIGTANILIAGVSDLTAEKYDINKKSNPKKSIANSPQNVNLKILLAHQPRSAFAAADAGFDVQLSGHTHGGQFWPWTWIIPLIQPFVGGLTRYKNMWLYVSRGTGYWGPPARLGSQSEITQIVFVRE